MKHRYALLMMGIVVIACTPAVYATPPPIAFGQSVYTYMDNAEQDSLAFEANAGDRVLARLMMCEDSGGQSCCCFDQRLIIVGPDQQEVTTAVSPANHNCCGCRFVTTTGQVPLTTSGRHTLIVSDLDGFGRGWYTVFLQRVSGPGRADTLAAGQPYLGTIESCGSVDTFVFLAHAGHPVQLHVQISPVGTVDPRIEVYNQSGLAVAAPNSGDLTFTPAATGYFRLLVHSNSVEIGDYLLTFWESPTAITTTSWGNVKVLYR